MSQKKYLSLTGLSNFLDKINAIYSKIGHKHTISDITDYKIDTSLSPTSNNPIANKAVNDEFEAIGEAINILETVIDNKASVSHNHNDLYYTKSEFENLELITVDDIDAICGTSIALANEVTF